MARVTYDEVQVIMDTVLSESELAAFIDMANLLVNENLQDESSMSDDVLKKVELNLAAHFACMKDPRPSSNRASSVSESYQYKLGLNLRNTQYGQAALMFDKTGILESITKGRKKISIGYLGNDNSDYWESSTR